MQKKKYFSKIASVLVGVFVVSIILIPLIVVAQDIVPCNGWLECDFCAFSVMISNLMNFLLFAIALPIGVIAMIIAGVIFITAGGNPSKVELGKKAFLYTLIGLLIAFGAWLIMDATLGALISPGYMPWHEFPGC